MWVSFSFFFFFLKKMEDECFQWGFSVAFSCRVSSVCVREDRDE